MEDLQDGYSPLIILFEHLQEEEQLYKIIFSSRGTQVVIERLRSALISKAKLQIEEHIAVEHLLAPSDIIAYHSVSALLGLALW